MEKTGLIFSFIASELHFLRTPTFVFGLLIFLGIFFASYMAWSFSPRSKKGEEEASNRVLQKNSVYQGQEDSSALVQGLKLTSIAALVGGLALFSLAGSLAHSDAQALIWIVGPVVATIGTACSVGAALLSNRFNWLLVACFVWLPILGVLLLSGLVSH